MLTEAESEQYKEWEAEMKLIERKEFTKSELDQQQRTGSPLVYNGVILAVSFANIFHNHNNIKIAKQNTTD